MSIEMKMRMKLTPRALNSPSAMFLNGSTKLPLMFTPNFGVRHYGWEWNNCKRTGQNANEIGKKDAKDGEETFIVVTMGNGRWTGG
jgi:hypothetical protein